MIDRNHQRKKKLLYLQVLTDFGRGPFFSFLLASHVVSYAANTEDINKYLKKITSYI